jgi:hypothetical protein
MKVFDDRRDADAAARALMHERRSFSARTAWLRARLSRYQPWLLVSGGFLAGWLGGRAKMVNAARRIIGVASLATALLRTSFGPLLMASLLGSNRNSRIAATGARDEKPQG